MDQETRDAKDILHSGFAAMVLLSGEKIVSFRLRKPEANGVDMKQVKFAKLRQFFSQLVRATAISAPRLKEVLRSKQR